MRPGFLINQSVLLLNLQLYFLSVFILSKRTFSMELNCAMFFQFFQKNLYYFICNSSVWYTMYYLLCIPCYLHKLFYKRKQVQRAPQSCNIRLDAHATTRGIQWRSNYVQRRKHDEIICVNSAGYRGETGYRSRQLIQSFTLHKTYLNRKLLLIF